MEFCLWTGLIGIGYIAFKDMREWYSTTFKVNTFEVKAKPSNGCYCGYCGAYCDTPFCKQCGSKQ